MTKALVQGIRDAVEVHQAAPGVGVLHQGTTWQGSIRCVKLEPPKWWISSSKGKPFECGILPATWGS